MLKTASDFENSVAYITKDLNKDMFKDIKLQGPVMNSENFDTTMNVISKELDALYEKTRVLNDIVLYAEEFIRTNVYNKKLECDAILKSVEDNRDKLRSNAYIFFDVNFLPGAGSYTDRDSSELPHADISSNNIVLSGDTVAKIAPKSFSRVTETHTDGDVRYFPIRQNIDELINGTPYRSYYLLDKPAEGGIRETIKCEFNSECTINSFEVIPSNCNIDFLQYIDNDQVEIDSDMNSVIKKQRTLTDVNINISSDNYNRIDINATPEGAQTLTAVEPLWKYEYKLGIDSVNASMKNINSTCCHISQGIDLGAIDDSTFIQLSAEYYSDQDSSVEFYVVDGGREYPIIPVEDSTVSNEKIFYGLESRFAVNKTKSYTIKKDGIMTNSVSIDQLSQLNDGNYTIDYTPIESYNHSVSDNIIKIKTVVRTYNPQGAVPYISKLEIRKYGGDGLWKTN